MKPFLRNGQSEDPCDPGLSKDYREKLARLPLELSDSRLQAIAELGALARLQENYADSQKHFQMAIDESIQLRLPAFEIANRIRLGLTYHYANYFALAEACFRQALAACRCIPEASSYTDFALQHLGKLCVEQNRFTEARICFEEALVLREAKGDHDLIASTQQALQSLAALMSNK